MQGILDGLVDAQFERKVKECLSPARIELALNECIQEMDTKHNALVMVLANYLRDNDEAMAELLSRIAFKLAFGDIQPVQGEEGEEVSEADKVRPAARRIVRTRLVRQLMNEKNIDRRKARAAVSELTDDQIDSAVRGMPMQVRAGVGDWFGDLWTWIKNNWLTIASILLPIVLLLL